MRRYLSRLSHIFFEHRPVFVYLFQATIVAVSLLLSWLLRFDFALPDRRMLLLSTARGSVRLYTAPHQGTTAGGGIRA
jgi:hypothetical protein